MRRDRGCPRAVLAVLGVVRPVDPKRRDDDSGTFIKRNRGLKKP